MFGNLIGFVAAIITVAILAAIDCYDARKGDNNDREGK